MGPSRGNEILFPSPFRPSAAMEAARTSLSLFLGYRTGGDPAQVLTVLLRFRLVLCRNLGLYILSHGVYTDAIIVLLAGTQGYTAKRCGQKKPDQIPHE